MPTTFEPNQLGEYELHVYTDDADAQLAPLPATTWQARTLSRTTEHANALSLAVALALALTTWQAVPLTLTLTPNPNPNPNP